MQEFKKRQKAGDLRGARILTVMYRFMSEPFNAGLREQDAGGRPRQGRRDRRQGRRLREGLDRRPGRPPSQAHAGIHRRGDGSGEEAQHDRGWRISSSSPTRGAWSIRASTSCVHNVRDQDIPDDFIATLKEKNVSVISTLAREEGAVRLWRRTERRAVHRQSVLPEGADAAAAGRCSRPRSARSRPTIRHGRAGCACSTPTRRT